MNSVPEPTNTDSEARADAILKRMPAAELDALAASLARLLISAERRLNERGESLTGTAPMPPPAVPVKRRRRPNPSRLAKWEAHWQAEHDAEGES